MPNTQKKSASLYSAFKEIINPQKLKPATQTITNGDINNIILQINEMMRKIYNKAFAKVLELNELKVNKTLTTKSLSIDGAIEVESVTAEKTVNAENVNASNKATANMGEFSGSVSVGPKTRGNDGKNGVSMGSVGYLLMQRNDGAGPYIGFYKDSGTSPCGYLQITGSNGYMEFKYAPRYTFDKAVYAPSFYENNEALSAKYAPAANFNGFKVYTLADLGITGNTTFNAVCSALSSLKSNNPWMFICAQGVLTSGITDMPEGYGLLTVTQIAGRFSVEYKAPNKLYFSLRNETQMKEIKPSLLKSISPD